MNPILKINDNYVVDESITDYERYAFNPITGTQFNNPGSITIKIFKTQTTGIIWPIPGWNLMGN